MTVQPPGHRLGDSPCCVVSDLEWIVLRQRASAVSWRWPPRRYRARL